MGIPCLVLVDGEHYPPVTRAALATLEGRGFEVRAALFLGGTEKIAGLPDLGVPLAAGEVDELLPKLIAEHRPEIVLDLSDEPVVGYRRRMELAGRTLSAGAAYGGADFRFDPPARPRLTELPTVAVVGTGKRTGKTAVAIELARHWRDEGKRVCIVTMGRGGPPDPVVLRADRFEPDPEGLLALAEEGLHAASDYVEDAVFARVDTVGTRRCGAGLAGAPMTDNFAAGVAAAKDLDPEILIYEGSGTALPPAAADVTVLVMLGSLDPEYLRGYFGPYRLALADVVVVLHPRDELLETLAELVPDRPVLVGRMAPEATVAIEDRRVLLATTAPVSAKSELRVELEARGAARVEVVHSLSDRARLTEELESVGEVEVALAEVKAAAVDVVVPWARERGIAVGLVHNRVVLGEDGQNLASLVEGAW